MNKEEKLNINLLNTLKIDVLKEVKSESEKALNHLHSLEENITSKSLTILQVTLSISLVLLGVVINDIADGNMEKLSILALSLLVLFAVVIGFLTKNVLAKDSVIIGSTPSILCQEDLVGENVKDHTKSITINRIWNLEEDISICLESYEVKMKNFKRANRILFFGLAFIALLMLALFYPYCSSSC